MSTHTQNMKIRRSQERGHAEFEWLDSYHSFSFGEYYDPQHMGFRSLRVINEDWIAGGQGFGAHPHRDMEIITLVLDGELAHKDSMGNGETIRPGDLQKMSAGKGIVHSEFNASETKPVHLLQIWILPERAGITPSYAQVSIKDKMTVDGLTLVAGPADQVKDIIPIYQDAKLHYGYVSKGKTLSYQTSAGRGLWLQMIDGTIAINGEVLGKGDAVSFDGVESIGLNGNANSQFLLFDLK